MLRKSRTAVPRQRIESKAKPPKAEDFSDSDESADLIFKFDENAPEILEDILLEQGWIAWDPDMHQKRQWNLAWRSGRPAPGSKAYQEKIQSWQRVNRFPRQVNSSSTAFITRKDELERSLRRVRGQNSKLREALKFHPCTFIMPGEYPKFITQSRGRPDNTLWIVKPVDQSQGRGIRIFKDVKKLQYQGAAIIQEYIQRPLLIEGLYKFDLRIYALVTSFKPLVLYLYNDGIARFCTEKYDRCNLKNVFSHLTNTSINKESPYYQTNKRGIGCGCRWNFNQLRAFLGGTMDSDRMNLLWLEIQHIAISTLALQASSMCPQEKSCFDLYGIDVLIDGNLKPWLVEINASPSMVVDSEADVVKRNLMTDLIKVIRLGSDDAINSNNSKLDNLNVRDRRKPPLRSTPSPAKPYWICQKSSSDNQSAINYGGITMRISNASGSDSEEEWNDSANDQQNKTPSSSSRSSTSSGYGSQLSRKSSVDLPYTKIGDFILCYPFNTFTSKATGIASIIERSYDEVLRYRRHIKSTCSTTCGNGESFTEQASSYQHTAFRYEYAQKNKNPFYFWGPAYPPLRSKLYGD